MPVIPDRQPIADHFSGAVLHIQEVYLLTNASQEQADVTASGQFVIRYGVQYLGKPHLAIVPGLVALDYGEIITGEEAWDFVLHRSNLHPRADVVGYRNDGADDMIAIKLLDPVAPVHVLVYLSETDTKPVARVSALVAADTLSIPARLQKYLLRFESLEAWQRHE